MKINYNVTGPKRKALVNAISQQLNAPVKYLGAPTFAYEVADYNVNKNGVLSGPDKKELVDDLLGLHDFKAISEEFDAPPPKAEANETEESINLIIQMPRADFTDTAIENLKGLVESKATLIKKAIDTDSIPIIVNEEFVAFPWFQGECSSEEVKAYTHFVTALCEMAKKQTRVNSTEKSVENEKYAFRCFLLRLGFIGPEYKMERKILLSKLSGSSAFKSGTAKQEVSEQ
ncbi:virulence protein [Clostridium sporogenes]|uniref:virulence protein n=1 Tax=Clostridium sporogenes TaxID=1509 RepID=UPI0013C7257E|nr:virulence protein [Clostridium sporogenes]MDS1005593.1 virulence protein [Clostridium sporogenes]NFQ02078.1 virulence protein [Clostridium sporogenes]NFQ40452.1 virulence protein [Clostridium sporogenes]NFT02321.1 virulence protein [Clostridium sporogenes]NFT29986.1 virulence protein [Clostridium sporogenes]